MRGERTFVYIPLRSVCGVRVSEGWRESCDVHCVRFAYRACGHVVMRICIIVARIGGQEV